MITARKINIWREREIRLGIERKQLKGRGAPDKWIVRVLKAEN